MLQPAQPVAAALLFLPLLTLSCAGAPSPGPASPSAPAAAAPHDQEHARVVAAWRKERLERLTAETGFLALAGLFWLEQGTRRLGSAPEAEVRFPSRAPGVLGTVTLKEEITTLTLAQGIQATVDGAPAQAGAITLRHDGHPGLQATRVAHDGFTFKVIKRGARLAIRLWDRESPTRTGFKGLRHYPVRRRWLVKGHYTPYARPKPIQIPTVVKTTTDALLTGEVRLTLGGKEATLYPIAWPGDQELFFHFTDGTTGGETYGGGRFLVTEHPVHKGGEVLLDFNRSYTPPCAFTRYATCPVPLERNRLPVPVTAGEREP